MVRVQLPESKLKRSRRRRRIAKVALTLFLFFVVVGLAVGLTYLPHLQVVAVEVRGAEGTEAAAVEQAVQKQLWGYYLYIFPRDNVVLYPRAHITSNLLTQFPTFSTVEVRAKTLRLLSVEVSKRSPYALWCGVARLSPTSCFILDEKGVAYENAADFGGVVYTTYYGELAGSILPRQYLDEETFGALVALVAALEEQQGMHITSVEVDGVGDTHLRFINGFEIIFALKDSSGDIYERFVLALTAEPFEGRSTSDFEYLDLRFGDRLYYKLKGE